MLTSKQVLEHLRQNNKTIPKRVLRYDIKRLLLNKPKSKGKYFIIFTLSETGYYTELNIESEIYDTFDKARESIICNCDNYDYDKYDGYELNEYSWVYETRDEDYYILSLQTDERYLHLTSCCQDPPQFEVSDDCDFITDMKESVSRIDINDDSYACGDYIVFDLYNYRTIQEWDGWHLECYREDEYYETKKDILEKLAHIMYKRIWYKRLKTYLESDLFSEWYYSPTGPGGKRVIKRLQAKAQLETSNPPP